MSDSKRVAPDIRITLANTQPMTQPMTSPLGGIHYYRPRYGRVVLEPSAVERLAALADPDIALRVANYDRIYGRYEPYGHMDDYPLLANPLG